MAKRGGDGSDCATRGPPARPCFASGRSARSRSLGLFLSSPLPPPSRALARSLRALPCSRKDDNEQVRAACRGLTASSSKMRCARARVPARKSARAARARYCWPTLSWRRAPSLALSPSRGCDAFCKYYMRARKRAIAVRARAARERARGAPFRAALAEGEGSMRRRRRMREGEREREREERPRRQDQDRSPSSRARTPPPRRGLQPSSAPPRPSTTTSASSPLRETPASSRSPASRAPTPRRRPRSRRWRRTSSRRPRR